MRKKQKNWMYRNGNSSAKVHHSRWFHRYYEGYAEHRTEGKDGKISIHRYYVGNYYRQDLSRKKRVTLRIGYVVTFFIAALLFLRAGTADLASNRAIPVIFLQMIAVVVFSCLFITLLCYLAAGRDMEIHTYRETSEGTIRYSGMLSLLIGLTGLVSFFVCLMQNIPVWQAGKLFLTYFVSAGCILFLFFTEKKVHYVQIPNPVVPFDEDVIIES